MLTVFSVLFVYFGLCVSEYIFALIYQQVYGKHLYIVVPVAHTMN